MEKTPEGKASGGLGSSKVGGRNWVVGGSSHRDVASEAQGEGQWGGAGQVQKKDGAEPL